jgi:O-acetyl-ADP-ribose deacetylase (regulator of RNase III)
MNRKEKIITLNGYLLKDEPTYKEEAEQFPKDMENQRRLLRSLMNLRYPKKKLLPEYFRLQDELLGEEREEKGVVSVFDLPVTKTDPRISIWQGDITRLEVDAIVNAANSQMLGCFVPCHACIDNAIHSAAGLQLRDECMDLMRAQGHEEPTGRAKITKGYNLPAKYVLHTVGPIVEQSVTEENRQLLASCYQSCMELADAKKLKSVAFCCISTGLFRFPNDLAAFIAVKTVREYFDLHPNTSIKKVVFNVFKDLDHEIYVSLMNEKI